MEKQNLKIKQKYFFGFGSTMEKQKYDKEQSLRQSIIYQSCNITYKRNVIGQVLSFFFLIFIIFFSPHIMVINKMFIRHRTIITY